MDEFMRAAIDEARKGGVPIGSVLAKNGVIVGRGHNKRVHPSLTPRSIV